MMDMPAASARMDQMLTLTITSTSSVSGGIKAGTSYSSSMTLASGSYSALFPDTITITSCQYYSLPATATKLIIYLSGDSNSAGKTASLTATLSTQPCRMITLGSNARSFVVGLNSTDAVLLTMPWLITMGMDLGYLVTSGGSSCKVEMSSVLAAPYGSLSTTVPLFKAAGSAAILVTATSNITCAVNLTMTPYVCTTFNSSACPTIGYKTYPLSSLASFGDALIALVFLFLPNGHCVKDYLRASTCMNLYPKCDSNNFFAPICQSQCAAYADCMSSDATCATTFSSTYPVSTTSVAGAECASYSYTSAGSSVVPSVLGLLFACVVAFVSQRF
jgi:hypothetical protein